MPMYVKLNIHKGKIKELDLKIPCGSVFDNSQRENKRTRVKDTFQKLAADLRRLWYENALSTHRKIVTLFSK